MRMLFALAALTAAVSAHAADLTYQGRLVDATGTAVSHPAAEIRVELFDAQDSSLGSQTFTGVAVQQGYFGLAINAFTAAALNDAATIQLFVDGVAMGAPQPLGASPRAASLSESPFVGLVTVTDAREWADGTHARSCDEYLHPAGPYAYVGATGDGLYRIDPDGPGTYTLSPYVTYCLQTEHGGGWTRVLHLADNIATGNLTAVANNTERIDLGDFTLTADVLRQSDRQVLIVEDIAPYRTHRYRMDAYCEVSDVGMIGMITGDYSSACVGVWDWVGNNYVSHNASVTSGQSGGRCNTNNHTQWNCTPANGVRFHWGTRDFSGDGGTLNPGTGAWGWFTGYNSGYGDYSRLVLNWNNSYDATPHTVYVR